MQSIQIHHRIADIGSSSRITQTATVDITIDGTAKEINNRGIGG